MGDKTAVTELPFAAVTVLHETFPDLDNFAVQQLSRLASPNFYEANEDICREGEVGETLHILARGEAAIIVKGANDKEVLVDTLAEHSYFGEVALFGESIRTATIRTITACHTLEIKHSSFMAIANTSPQLLNILLKQVIGHLRRNDRAVIQTLNEQNMALQKAYGDLAQQEQFRQQFITVLSHELRTPLTSIRGFLDLIQSGAIRGESLQAALGSVARNAEKLVGLTNDLLALYEMNPGALEFEAVNLPDLLIAALNGVRQKLEGHKTAVQLDIAPDLPSIYGDERALTLAVSAIIENAFKFDPQQNPVVIEVRRVDDDDVVIEIRDQGIGIGVADQQRMFEPFTRLEQEGGPHLFAGVGAGLTIAQQVVERHNGRIDVRSQLGEGSRFAIILPISAVR